MTTTVKSPDAPVIVTFADYLDTASQTYGDGQDRCGARIYTIVEQDVNDDVSAFFSYTGQTLTLQSTQDADIGTYPMVLTVSLADYPGITATVNFNVIVGACEIRTIITPASP